MADVQTAIDLDAIYSGDVEAVGDAIRVLAGAVSRNKGVLPVLTDRIIIPKFAGAGLLIETEEGQRVWEMGSAILDSLGGVFGSINTSPVGLDLQKQLYLGDWIDVPGPFSSAPTNFGAGTTGQTSTEGVNRSLYRAQPTSEDIIDSIYKPLPNSTTNEPEGRVIVIWNDSAYNLALWDNNGVGGTGASGHAFIAGPPVVLAPQGAAILSYVDDYDWGANGVDGAWIVVASTRTGWLSYAPSLVAVSGSPALGTGGSLTGAFSLEGETVQVQGLLTLGTGFSLGTSPGITLPFPYAGVASLAQIEAFDVGTNAFLIRGVTATINSQPAVALLQNTATRAFITSTVPFTFVAGDQIWFHLTYRRS